MGGFTADAEVQICISQAGLTLGNFAQGDHHTSTSNQARWRCRLATPAEDLPITRKPANVDIVSKVEYILKSYFENVEKRREGLPSVKYLASMVNLSPGYLSDLLKKETGLNAQDHIHHYIIEQAKNILVQTNFSISEIAYSLGFEYPQYFSRLFKQKTGRTPLEYRLQN